MANGAVQRQLTQEEAALQVGRHLLGQDQQRDGDGQIVGGAFLAQVGGGQVDGEPAAGIGQTGVVDRRAHALGGFLHRGVGQADQGHGGQGAGVEIGLNLDHGAFQADQRATVDFGEHHDTSRGSRGGGVTE